MSAQWATAVIRCIFVSLNGSKIGAFEAIPLEEYRAVTIFDGAAVQQRFKLIVVFFFFSIA